MDAPAVYYYGHQEILRAFEGFPEDKWQLPDAVGEWSPQDILAHLAVQEQVLGDIFSSFVNSDPTPMLDGHRSRGDGFMTEEVLARRARPAAEILAEYQAAYERALNFLNQIPLEKRRQAGTLPWYGDPYSLEDLLVYMGYGHKREHAAHIGLVRDRIAAG